MSTVPFQLLELFFIATKRYQKVKQRPDTDMCLALNTFVYIHHLRLLQSQNDRIVFHGNHKP